jgi:hypothetical protein
MKGFLNAIGGLIVLWLCVGLPIALIWLVFDYDWGTYWFLCIIGLVFFLLYSSSKK